jgi:Tfp pilus assembly protein PilX
MPTAIHERGTVLVMAMVILLILTIIGITAMNTSSLEAKMATNIQETNRAFTAAESGVNKALVAPNAFDLHATYVRNDFIFGSIGAQSEATVDTSFRSFSTPKRGSGYSAVNYDSANFDQKAIGNTNTGARAVLHQGASQIVNKAQ